MSQTIHVIKASGTRFQHEFPDNTPPAKILADLDRIKARYGYNATVLKPDPNVPGRPVVEFEDKTSGFAFDNPETVVAVVDPASGKELKRLKGPPAKGETPAT